ncbi:MAG: PIG-L family deacetylase [Armatimonadetes bacterium]|nr:PIG-L family deacetylase [Armatimonadota bacterium]
MHRKKVLALCAHPDDAEFRCGGTLILLAQRGWEVHIATISVGDCGSAELSPEVIASIRLREAEAAVAKLGGKYHSLGGKDLQIYDDNPTRAAAVVLIRELAPDLVITHYPIDYMPDHTATSAIARTAVFTAPIKNYLVGPAADVRPSGKGVVPLYYFGPLEGTDWFGNPVHSEFYVDISSVIDKKAEMLGCHESQREWLRRQHGVDQYIETMKSWDAQAGKIAGVSYAEGFTMHRGHAYPQMPILQEALSDMIIMPTSE